MKIFAKKFYEIGFIVMIIFLSGCSVCLVDSYGNRNYSGFMWIKKGTVDQGRVGVVLIKSLGLDATVCHTGAGVIFGYKSRLLTRPSRSTDTVSKMNLSERGIDDPGNRGSVGFVSISIPAHKGASLQEASQFGASLSTCSDYPVVGLGYQSKIQIEYDRNGKAYYLKYASGRPASIRLHEINPDEDIQ